MRFVAVCVSALFAVFGAHELIAQTQKTVDIEIVGHVYQPQSQAPDQSASDLRAPAGFRVSRFATGLGKPRMLAVGDDGTVYITRREPGDVLMLRDGDGDGHVEPPQTILTRKDLHGIAIHAGRMYLATVKEVLSAPILKDGRIGEVKTLVSDLPDGGQHPNRTLAVGPDGLLYVSIGSTCNACPESTQEHASIVRVDLDGRNRKVFASGLRNTIGFGWQPDSRALFGMDNGIDWLGDDAQPEELNELREGGVYGWPYVYENGKINPATLPPPGTTKERWATKSTSPVLTYTAHSAPLQMVFYQANQFPSEFRGDAFVAMHGSWNRRPPSGYEVVRIHFENGRPVKIEPFLTGFLKEKAGQYVSSGRPAGLAVARDGSLLVGDDEHGVIYRVSYARPRNLTRR
jgi:glucose/arabinose dehydrogenase